MKNKHLSDKQISAFIDGEIISEEEKRHLEECSLCARKLKSYRTISNAVGELKPLSATPSIIEKVKSEISKETIHSNYSNPSKNILLRYTYAISGILLITLVASSVYIFNILSETERDTVNFQSPKQYSETQLKVSSNTELDYSEDSSLESSEDTLNLLLALSLLDHVDEFASGDEFLDVENLLNLPLSDVVLSLGDEIGMLEEY